MNTLRASPRYLLEMDRGLQPNGSGRGARSRNWGYNWEGFPRPHPNFPLVRENGGGWPGAQNAKNASALYATVSKTHQIIQY